MRKLTKRPSLRTSFASAVFVASAMATSINAFAHPEHGEDDDVKNHVEQNFDLRDFNKIAVVGVYNMDVSVGTSDYSIHTSGDEEDMSEMNVYVKNGTLYLATDEDSKRRGWKKKDNKGIDITITLPSLVGLEVTGVGSGEVSGIDSEEFDVEIAGIGALELSGRCGRLDADYAGMGELDAKDLECEDVSVDMSGMGSASVYASESVDAEMSGMGSIDVYGSPKKVKKNKGFMSSIDIH